ncbi:MAG: NirD/YgiW/YdeI family stress tolerance protein [Alphaproteobacteria bacterium]
MDIEIDDKDWRGLVVGPDDVVIIEGEVDKGWTKLEIEVDNIRKAN